MRYLTRGCQENAEETLLGAMFYIAYDEMVIVKDVEMLSLCEHHLLLLFWEGSCRIDPARESDRTQ